MPLRITEAAAAALQAQNASKDVFVFDTVLSGYALRRTPTGTVIHQARARVAGRKINFTVGRWPQMRTAEARELARLALADMKAGRDPAIERRTRQHAAAANSMTVAAFAEKWLIEHVQAKLKPLTTARDCASQLRRHIIPALGHRTIAELSYADINALHAKMKATPRAANYAIGTLRSLLQHAILAGLRTTNPARQIIRYPETLRERFLSERESEAALNAIDKATADGTITIGAGAGLKLALYTGARRGEICATRWTDIDWDRRLIRLKEGKTGPRTIYLSDVALDVLRSLPRTGPTVVGVKWRQLDRAWEAVRQRCGLDDVRLHDLRHSYASLALKQGVSLARIGKLLGHRRASTTERYSHLAADDVAAAADIVGAAFTAATAPSEESTVIKLHPSRGKR
jgi:integrase